MPTPPRSVLFVSHLGEIEGGADRMLAVLTQHLDSRHIQPAVLLPKQASLAQSLDQHHIPYHVVPFRGWVGKPYPWWILYRLLMNVIGAFRAAYRLRNHNFDYVYSNSLYAPTGALLARLLNVPHIWHIHELLDQPHLALDFGNRISLHLVDHLSQIIIFSSEGVRAHWQPHLSNAQQHVVHSVIPYELTPPPPRTPPGDELHLCIVGRISPLKGQADAIKAVHRLQQQGITAHLQIAGDGKRDDIAALKQEAQRLSIADQIEWLGFVDDPREVYDQADIALVCSRSEGFGIVVVEAMARGCPVVASRVGAIPEIINHGGNGQLYQQGDIDDLTHQIITLTTDSQRYQRITQNALHTVQNQYTMSHYVQQIERIILNTDT